MGWSENAALREAKALFMQNEVASAFSLRKADNPRKRPRRLLLMQQPRVVPLVPVQQTFAPSAFRLPQVRHRT